MRFELLGIFLSLTLLISGFGYGVNYADAKGPDEPCNYLDRHHSIKISHDGSKYPGVAHCEKVDYWVPEKCGKIAGLYKTDSECQPPPVLVSEPAPTPAPTPTPTATDMPPPSQFPPTESILFFALVIMIPIVILIAKNRHRRKSSANRSFYTSRTRKSYVTRKSGTRWSTNRGTTERTPIDGKTKNMVFRRAKYRCQNCGISWTKAGYLTIDHKKPVSIGGSDNLRNLRALCNKCNKEKGTKYRGRGRSFEDW